MNWMQLGKTFPASRCASYNYAASATVVNNLNLGFLRDKGQSGAAVIGPGLDALGLHGLPFTGPRPYPAVSMDGGEAIGTEVLSHATENRYVVNDNLVLLKGKHTLSLGGEVRRLQRNESVIGSNRWVFTPTVTALNGTGFINGNGNAPVSIPAGTGNGVASFLVGGVDFSRVDQDFASHYRWLQTGMYIQDDWKVTPSLTLNLGLRYDLYIPRTELNHQVSTVDPLVANPAAGGLLGSYAYFGDGSGRNGKTRIGEIDYRAFQPRIGLAYSIDRKTVIRSGFGIIRPLSNDNLEKRSGDRSIPAASRPLPRSTVPPTQWARQHTIGTIRIRPVASSPPTLILERWLATPTPP